VRLLTSAAAIAFKSEKPVLQLGKLLLEIALILGAHREISVHKEGEHDFIAFSITIFNLGGWAGLAGTDW